MIPSSISGVCGDGSIIFAQNLFTRDSLSDCIGAAISCTDSSNTNPRCCSECTFSAPFSLPNWRKRG